MKRILIGLSLMAAACSGSLPTSPSGSSTVQSLPNASAPTAADAVVVNPVDPTPPAPGANAPTPQYTLTGPRDPLNCFTAGTDPMQWVLNVTDAGPRHLRFVALAHQDGQPGCDATYKNPRSRLEISGVTGYTPHSSGQTTLTFNPLMYSCGRVQVDVSIFDSAGNEILIIGIVINYGTVCAPTPPPGPGALACVPGSSTAPPGTPVTFSATGGTGTYTWSTPGGSPATSAGASMSTTYSTVGSYVATVSSGGATATCSINIVSTVVTTLACVPPVQTVGIGATATMVAAGGTGSYTWSAPGGSTASGSGTTFSTSYPGVSTNTVTVTSGGLTATCQVTVVTEPPPTPVLVCAPPTQTVAAGVLATLSAIGGTGAYTWSAPGGSAATGSGATFSTSYPGAGTNSVTVTSGTQTATCAVIVIVPPPVVPAPVCVPAPTNPAPSGGVPLTFNISNAVAGVVYTWATAPAGGTPAVGTGTTFTASFTAPLAGGVPITYTVTPSAPGLPGTPCSIAIPPPTTPPVAAPMCWPEPGNPPPSAGVPLSFSIFNPVAGATYSWAVTPAGGTPAAGTGTSFTTSLAGPPAGSPPIVYTITPSVPGAPGVACTVVIAPPSSLCPPPAPSFSVVFPLGGVLGRASVNGPGVWVARLLAATTLEKYTLDTPDVEKDTETVTLVCPSPTTPVSALIEVTYPWGGHPDRYWWMVLELNGVRIYKSPVAVNPTTP